MNNELIETAINLEQAIGSNMSLLGLGKEISNIEMTALLVTAQHGQLLALISIAQNLESICEAYLNEPVR